MKVDLQNLCRVFQATALLCLHTTHCKLHTSHCASHCGGWNICIPAALYSGGTPPTLETPASLFGVRQRRWCIIEAHLFLLLLFLLLLLLFLLLFIGAGAPDTLETPLTRAQSLLAAEANTRLAGGLASRSFKRLQSVPQQKEILKAINTLKVLAASQQSWEGGDCVGMDQNPSFGQRGGGAVVLPSPRSLPSSSRGRAVVLARPRGVREPGQEVRLSLPSETMPRDMN